MTEHNAIIDALLDQWESSRARGQAIPPALLCAAHPELLAVVQARIEALEKAEGLLGGHRRAAETLDMPAPKSAPASADAGIGEGPGAMIGRYKILKQIGEGGMGEVFLAEQREPIRRQVALKVIKLGMDSRQVIARFEAERQALAMMDHPNIARVFDAGTTPRGRPYFVMELVKGLPITEYCDREKIGFHERLRLIIQVCHAVQHAHQKGIIHRDLKPMNVLVTLQDGVPTPKVIDFGIAKATNQSLTEKTLFTEFGTMVGTPEYMSPEQAAMNDLDIDTRTDVYAIGVILYELMTGSTPMDSGSLRRLGYAEMQRAIIEDPIPRPSAKLSTQRKLWGELASTRGVSPKKLDLLVRGDIDWMVMKALEKDRKRRYESVCGFADDIERYLNNQPVTASPPSRLYTLSKFARRNRVGLGVTALFLVLVIGGLTAYFLSMRAEQRRTNLALIESRKQEAIAREQGAIAQSERAKAIKTISDVTYGLQRTLEQADASPEVREAINRAVSQPLESLRDDYANSETTGVEEIDRAIAAQMLHAGAIARDRGKLDLAISLTEQALERFTALANDPQSLGYMPRDRMVCLMRLLDLHLRAGSNEAGPYIKQIQALKRDPVHSGHFQVSDLFASEILAGKYYAMNQQAQKARESLEKARGYVDQLNPGGTTLLVDSPMLQVQELERLINP